MDDRCNDIPTNSESLDWLGDEELHLNGASVEQFDKYNCWSSQSGPPVKLEAKNETLV